jgi:hypothetical protein
VIVIVPVYASLSALQNVSLFGGSEQPGPNWAQECGSFLVNDAIAAGAVLAALVLTALIRQSIDYRQFAHFAWAVIIRTALVATVLRFFVFILSNIGI